MKSRIALFLAAALAAPLLSGQGAPITGTAHLGASAPATGAVGGNVDIRISVNLSDVRGTTGSGTVPAVLGAYQIAVTFDTTRLRYVSASGGTSSGFTGAPTATNPSTANGSGKVTITAAQTSSTAPTGNVSVATLTFTALAPGSAAISASGVSLSSAFVPPSYGPSSIPSTAGSAVITLAAAPEAITNPSPADGALVDEPVVLSWTAAPSATSYDVYFGRNTPQLLGNTSGTSFPVSTSAGTGYNWRVVSKNASGSTPSATFHFTTRGTTSCTTPATPQLSGPASVNSGAPFTISWNAIGGVADYRVEESLDAAFTSPTATTVAGTELALTKQVTSATTYYFRVTSRNGGAGCDVGSAPSATLAVVVNPPGVPAAQLRYIPAVISGAGANGSFFRTALQLHNPTAARIAGRLVFHPAGTEGKASDPSKDFALDPGQTLYYADVVVALGSQGLGSLDVVVDNGVPPRAVARVLNDAGAAGTTGMFEPLLATEDALASGAVATLLAPPDPVAARYNVGIRTLAPTDVTIELWNSSHVLLASSTRYFPANAFEQMSVADYLGFPPGANATLVVRIGSGRAFVYGAATDNVTQDPSLDLARP